MGYRSAAIVGGTTSLHRELEIELARLKGTEDCLLFPTGKHDYTHTHTYTHVQAPCHLRTNSNLAISFHDTCMPDMWLAMSVCVCVCVRVCVCVCVCVGFAANMAVVSSLAGLGPQGTHIHILSDELNHASIIDGARLATRGGSDVTLHVYRHNDMKHVEQVRT